MGSFVLDFFCNSARLDVELDGSQHYTPTGIAQDRFRDEGLRALGVEILRFSNHDVLTNLSGVLETIHEKVRDMLTDETPVVFLRAGRHEGDED